MSELTTPISTIEDRTGAEVWPQGEDRARISPRWVGLLIVLILLGVVGYYASVPDGTVAAIAAFVIGIVVLMAFELTTQRDWFRPRILVLSVLSLYALPLPAVLMAAPSLAVLATPAQVAQSCLIVLFSYLGVMLGDLTPRPRAMDELVRRFSLNDATLRAVFVLFAAVVTPIFLFEFLRLTRSGYFDLGRAERLGYASMHGVGLFFPAYTGLMLLCIFSIVPVFDARGRTLDRLKGYALVGLLTMLILVTVVFIESRYLLAVALLGTMTVIHRRYRRLPKAAILAVALLATLIFMVMAFTRADYRMGALGPAESFHPLRHGELRELHESTIYTAAYLEEHAPLYGATYFNAYRVVLPRFLVARPAELKGDDDDLIRVDPTLWYSALKSFDRFSRGHHFGFSSTAEAYLNFGLAGPCIVFALFIIALRTLHENAARGAFFLGMYAIAAGSTFWFIRSPVAYYVKDWLMFFLVPVFLLAAVLAWARPILRDA